MRIPYRTKRFTRWKLRRQREVFFHLVKAIGWRLNRGVDHYQFKLNRMRDVISSQL